MQETQIQTENQQPLPQPSKMLNQAVVVDAASYLFWMMAEEVGMQRALDRVMDSAGGCLLQQPYSVGVLSQYQGFNELDDETKSEFGLAIANQIYETTSQGGLLSGVYHEEDAKNGRNISAAELDFGHLNMPPQTVEVTGDIEVMGTLCLRHPLPAVVFSTEPPKNNGGVIQIADTTKALGFHMPLFMSNIHCVQVEPQLYMLMGQIHIPTETDESARLWHHAVLNSHKFASGINFERDDGYKVSVEVTWQQKETIH